MERCLAQAVLPLVGLAAENVIRDRYMGCKTNRSRRGHPKETRVAPEVDLGASRVSIRTVAADPTPSGTARGPGLG
ncbi:MAG: hypothetical protein ACQESR_30285 [Planctomycetota bacterium]